jgi:pimeloyl-ACP methyl ester carboxylesterase
LALSLGGSVAHELLARRPELLDRVVIDGCSALPWWGTPLLKAGVDPVSAFLHTGVVVDAVGRALGVGRGHEDSAPSGFGSTPQRERETGEARCKRRSPEQGKKR